VTRGGRVGPKGELYILMEKEVKEGQEFSSTSARVLKTNPAVGDSEEAEGKGTFPLESCALHSIFVRKGGEKAKLTCVARATAWKKNKTQFDTHQ